MKSQYENADKLFKGKMFDFNEHYAIQNEKQQNKTCFKQIKGHHFKI